MDITSVDYLVKRADFSQGKVVSSAASLGEGDILVKVEYFALTANNLTYALTADRVGYWDFFPAPAGWGRIPVWGLGQVLQSRNNEIDPGEYLYGYFPMSTHIAMHPSKIRGDSLRDASRHRMHLSPAYNY